MRVNVIMWVARAFMYSCDSHDFLCTHVSGTNYYEPMWRARPLMLACDLTTFYKRLAFHYRHFVSSNSLKLKMNKLLAKWALAPLMTLSATIRAFFWLIRNGLIHFVMDPSRCRSSRSLTPSLGVWSEIRTCICWPIVLISQGVELDLISLIYVIKGVNWIDKIWKWHMTKRTNSYDMMTG